MKLDGFQNAYVTRNLDRAVEARHKTHDLGDFIFLDPDIEDKTPIGTGRAQVRVASAWAGSTQIEIIEPVGGMIDLYLPYPPDDDTLRFHHSAVRIDDWEAFRAQIASSGWTVAYESGLEGLEFVYLDARETLGHSVEYMRCTPEWWETLGYPAGRI